MDVTNGNALFQSFDLNLKPSALPQNSIFLIQHPSNLVSQSRSVHRYIHTHREIAS